MSSICCDCEFMLASKAFCMCVCALVWYINSSFRHWLFCVCPAGRLGCVPVHKNAMLTIPCTHTLSQLLPTQKHTCIHKIHTHRMDLLWSAHTWLSTHIHTHPLPPLMISYSILTNSSLTNWNRHTHTHTRTQNAEISLFYFSGSISLGFTLRHTLVLSLCVHIHWQTVCQIKTSRHFGAVKVQYANSVLSPLKPCLDWPNLRLSWPETLHNTIKMHIMRPTQTPQCINT